MSGKKRGRETALDMIRTLAVIFALVVPVWFFGQSFTRSDRQHIRAIDPSDAYQAFVQDTHGPVLSSAPAGWTPTVRSYPPLRVGYVKGESYLEYSGARGTAFLPEATGKAKRVGELTVGDVVWQVYKSGADQESLVLMRNGVTVLVGGVRETATEAELAAFAALVR